MPASTVVELLWGTGRKPRRGPKPSLSLEGIVGTAVELADAEGMGGVSMQRVADRLGYAKMSLYRYVPGKAELAALMLEQAIGLPPEHAATQSDSDEPRWRTELRWWAEGIFRRYRAHPWAVELSTGIRPMGPNELGWLEVALVAMAGIGLTGAERLDTVVVLNGHVRSLAQQSRGAVADGMEERLLEQMTEVMAAAADRYPEFSAVLGEPASTAPDRNDALHFGIDRILDGMESLVARRAG